MKQIIFIRHGETDQNLKEKAATKTGMHHLEGFKEEDYPLNETGISQAKATAEELKDTPIDVIFCSPLQRARQTADIVNEFHNAPIIEKEELKERQCGDYVGPAYHDLFDFDKNIQDDSIESLQDFVGRVFGVLDEISETSYENVAVVAHGGVHHVLRAYCLKLPLKGNIRIDRVPNGGVRIYSLD